MEFKLEKEVSQTLPSGYARIFHVVYLNKSNGSIENIFTYPTMSMVDKHFQNNSKHGFKFDSELIKIYPGAVYYAGDNDHNEMVKF